MKGFNIHDKRIKKTITYCEDEINESEKIFFFVKKSKKLTIRLKINNTIVIFAAMSTSDRYLLQEML